MIEKYLRVYYEQLGIGRDDFLALGRQDPADRQETFSMAVLALRTAAASSREVRSAASKWVETAPAADLPG